jgi:hypothetical protein
VVVDNTCVRVQVQQSAFACDAYGLYTIVAGQKVYTDKLPLSISCLAYENYAMIATTHHGHVGAYSPAPGTVFSVIIRPKNKLIFGYVENTSSGAELTALGKCANNE